MSLVELLVLLLVAGICGAVGKAIVGFMPGGFLVSIGVGFVGALIGTRSAPSIHPVSHSLGSRMSTSTGASSPLSSSLARATSISRRSSRSPAMLQG